MLGWVPALRVERHQLQLKRLGSSYGGWVFVHDESLNGARILSCGAGEDISFDIALAAIYNAKVLVVDPTPKAVAHVKAVLERLGNQETPRGHVDGLPYDLSGVRLDQLILCNKAVWNENTRLRFFSPPNPEHVSHSITNFQHNYAKDTHYIEVDAVTTDQLLSEHQTGTPVMIKLDIEGAEIEVLLDMLAKGIYPKQVLVEYDELSVPSRRSRNRVESAHLALLGSGYVLVHRDGFNFTYWLRQVASTNAQ